MIKKKPPTKLQKNSWKRGHHSRNLTGARSLILQVYWHTESEDVHYKLAVVLNTLNLAIDQLKIHHAELSRRIKSDDTKA